MCVNPLAKGGVIVSSTSSSSADLCDVEIRNNNKEHDWWPVKATSVLLSGEFEEVWREKSLFCDPQLSF